MYDAHGTKGVRQDWDLACEGRHVSAESRKQQYCRTASVGGDLEGDVVGDTNPGVEERRVGFDILAGHAFSWPTPDDVAGVDAELVGAPSRRRGDRRLRGMCR